MNRFLGAWLHWVTAGRLVLPAILSTMLLVLVSPHADAQISDERVDPAQAQISNQRLDPAQAEVSRQRLDPASDPLAEVATHGLVMKGYKDTEGLKRIIEHHFRNASLFGARTGTGNDVSAIVEAFREAGINAEIMREMESLVRGIDVSIYRVEFVPGFSGLDTPETPESDPWDALGFEEDGGLRPAGPRGGLSLVSSEQVYSIYGNHHGLQTNERGYKDGTVWYHASGRAANGDYIIFDRTTNTDGTTRFYRLNVFNPAGQQTHYAESHGDRRTPSAAEKDRQVRNRELLQDTGGNKGEGEGEAQGEKEGAGEGQSEDDPGKDVEKYQPADGGGGTFCPLLVEQCRRALARMVDSKDEVLVGVVHVNPGDPDDQPKGRRFVFDPEGLVINPSPETYERQAGGIDPRRFKMRIPVWVNPPNPNDPGENLGEPR